ncbi:uncharacterized protein [Hoplias malabaricus]|uniref:uncharacterized protein isoform X2 n=1 Tax=Hoplias malabaricus TaxID=27720 RepID=UPI003462A113
MAPSSYFLLLLVTHSVSTLQKERPSLYYIHTVHFSPVQMTSDDLQFPEEEGEKMGLEQAQGSWGRGTEVKREKPTFLQESDVFLHLLEISYNDTHHYEKRCLCETERSSNGDVMVLKSLIEYRHNRKVLLYFNAVDSVQCVVLDDEIPQYKSPSLCEITKDYLVQKCLEKLLEDWDFYNEKKTEGEAWSSEDVLIIVSRCLISYFVYRDFRNWQRRRHTREFSASVFDTDLIWDHITGWINSIIYGFKRKLRRIKTKTVQFPQKDVHGEYFNVFEITEEQNEGIIQIKRRLAASMDIPLTLAELDDDEDDAQNLSKHRLINKGRLAASMDIPITLGRPATSMDIPLTLGRLAASMDIPLTLDRLAASMDIPPTLAVDDYDEGQNHSEDRLKAAGRRKLMNISMPNLVLEKNISSDSQ